MNRDTLNKFVAGFQAASCVFALLDDITSLAAKIDLVARLTNEDELEAIIGALDALEPHTPEWLAWQIIKAVANELDA